MNPIQLNSHVIVLRPKLSWSGLLLLARSSWGSAGAKAALVYWVSLLVVLLGGLHQLWGSLAGALILVLAASALGRSFDYWRGALGLLVMALMVWAPSGVLGLRNAPRQGNPHG